MHSCGFRLTPVSTHLFPLFIAEVFGFMWGTGSRVKGRSRPLMGMSAYERAFIYSPCHSELDRGRDERSQSRSNSYSR